jgi:chaperonin GroEL
MIKRKDILFDEDAKTRILSGLGKAAKAVGSTLGAGGNTVLIQSQHHTSGLTTTKDGVTVMRSIILDDNAEDLAVRLLRQAATRTVTQAGDGTTTSVVLAESMARNAFHLMESHNNVTTVAEYMLEIAEETVERLQDKSISISDNKDELVHVATVSANNDESLGKIIAGAYKSVGDDGVVTVETSRNQDTYFDVTKGIKFKRGWISPFHITNRRNQTVEMDNPLILVTDLKIPSVKSIEHLLKFAHTNGRPLLIIGELEPEAQQTIDHNIYKNGLKAAFVIPPSFGARREDQMADIALAVGAKYITHRTGANWNAIKDDVLGEANKIIITQSDTTIMHEDGEIKGAVIDKISDLKNQVKEESDENAIEALNERIANLSGQVATVYVGAKTDGELKEKKDRVDDAVLATKAALEQGILPGGGIALLKEVGEDVEGEKLDDYRLAKLIMNIAFTSPFNKIMENAGHDPNLVIEEFELMESYNKGYDVKHNTVGNMIDLGIIDPTKITCSALLNATSAATTIMKTNTVIIDIEDNENQR